MEEKLSEKEKELSDEKRRDQLDGVRKDVLRSTNVFLGINVAIVFGIYATPAQMKCAYRWGPLMVAIGAGIVNLFAVIALAIKAWRLLTELRQQPSKEPPFAWVCRHNVCMLIVWFGEGLEGGLGCDEALGGGADYMGGAGVDWYNYKCMFHEWRRREAEAAGARDYNALLTDQDLENPTTSMLPPVEAAAAAENPSTSMLPPVEVAAAAENP